MLTHQSEHLQGFVGQSHTAENFKTSFTLDNEEIDQSYLLAHPQASETTSLFNPVTQTTIMQEMSRK